MGELLKDLPSPAGRKAGKGGVEKVLPPGITHKQSHFEKEAGFTRPVEKGRPGLKKNRNEDGYPNKTGRTPIYMLFLKPIREPCYTHLSHLPERFTRITVTIKKEINESF